MKVLFIGGTGNISSSVSRLATDRGVELWMLNRKGAPADLPGIHSLVADIHDEAAVASILQSHNFDVVANFINFHVSAIERDIRLFSGRCGQYIFISSASCYQKPPTSAIITESTPLKNPYWDYSQKKIECEDRLTRAYREENFPMTIIRPSLTYDKVIPAALGSWEDFTLIERIRQGRPIVVHGDGTSLWTVTHAEDFAKGMVGLLGHQQAIGHAFHITSDEILTWNQIYEAMGAAAGRQPEMVHVPTEFISKLYPSQKGGLLGDKAPSAIFDNSKIKRYVPDYCATIPFKKGIKKTVEWFDAETSRRNICEENNKMLDTIIEKYSASLNQLEEIT